MQRNRVLLIKSSFGLYGDPEVNIYLFVTRLKNINPVAVTVMVTALDPVYLASELLNPVGTLQPKGLVHSSLESFLRWGFQKRH